MTLTDDVCRCPKCAAGPISSGSHYARLRARLAHLNQRVAEPGTAAHDERASIEAELRQAEGDAA
jgi:hypothetical protein